MYCSHQYLSIEPKKVCDANFNAHKLEKIVNMNADIAKTVAFECAWENFF